MENKRTHQIPTLEVIREAHQRIMPYIRETPVMTCGAINQISGSELYFKCENFQTVGAFKYRGATNAVMSEIQESGCACVATHSSGNHAAALAKTAGLRGIPAHIVMPRTAPEIKKRAVAGYGGKIIWCEPTVASRESTLAEVVSRTGAVVIHPYNDYRVIAGQGTAVLELMESLESLDVVMTPVGGGGLLSGTILALRELCPSIRVVGCEPEGADDAYRSLQTGQIQPSIHPKTMADGLMTCLGDKTFPIIRESVYSIITVSETAILQAMRLIWERMKIIIEPSSAVPLAALLEHRDQIPGRKIGIILSGGNVDLDHLPWLR